MSQLSGYEVEFYSTQYQAIEDKFSQLIKEISVELTDEFFSDEVTDRYKKLRDSWIESISNCYGRDVYMYDSMFI